VVTRPLPFHCTWDDGTKSVPFTVSVKAADPAKALAGESGEVVVGTGLLQVKVWLLEVPPLGVGLNTATESVPPLAQSLAGTAACTSAALT
jgi:hypothetical protein